MKPMSDLVSMAMTIPVAIAAAMLVWALFDIGLSGLARHRETYTERAHVGLRELFLFVDPSRIYMLNLAVMGIIVPSVWLWSGALLPALLVAGVAGVAPRLLLRWLRLRRLERMEQQLPDALLMLAGGVKAGVSLTQAIHQLALESRPPVSQEFDLLLREQRIGVSLDDALANLNARLPLQSVVLAVAAMRIASETGGQLAEALERASHTLRQKLAMEGKIRALTSQGKLQASVVGALPLLLMFVLDKMEPAAMHLLFSTRMGWGTLVVIGLLEFFGVLIIRKIVDIDV